MMEKYTIKFVRSAFGENSETTEIVVHSILNARKQLKKLQDSLELKQIGFSFAEIRNENDKLIEYDRFVKNLQGKIIIKIEKNPVTLAKREVEQIAVKKFKRN